MSESMPEIDLLPEIDLVVVGGCGHVGLPLSLAFANSGLRVAAFDLDQQVTDRVNDGEMPFLEPDAPDVLTTVLAKHLFRATTDRNVVAKAEIVVVVIGTPVDEHLNPDPTRGPQGHERSADQLHNGQLLVLRSTVYPGVTRRVEQLLRGHRASTSTSRSAPSGSPRARRWRSCFELPQIVSGRTDSAVASARATLFGSLTDSIVELEPEEAELAKLFTNTWRYIKFAAANQFYMMANDHGLDFDRIRDAIRSTTRAPRTCPGPGFAAGPCLFKDTMQLAAFTDNSFALGHSAMLINEGLPLYLVSRLEKTLRPRRARPSASSGWRSRARATTSGRACPTSCGASCTSGPRRCSAPTRTSPATTLLPLEEVLERCGHPGHRRTAPPRTSDLETSIRRSSTCGTCSARSAL